VLVPDVNEAALARREAISGTDALAMTVCIRNICPEGAEGRRTATAKFGRLAYKIFKEDPDGPTGVSLGDRVSLSYLKPNRELPAAALRNEIVR
jgi:hypothetical protein